MHSLYNSNESLILVFSTNFGHQGSNLSQTFNWQSNTYLIIENDKWKFLEHFQTFRNEHILFLGTSIKHDVNTLFMPFWLKILIKMR